ncbi:MAG: Ferri-bacillibactin esterase BesA [Paracidovorax wautersii]|uniref:Ferri-bacillibactin esterase BesA n=1 Tax=Paracidovorax wautersii TaxID=1177982 RepID=A0A7V8JRZ8_9BURK|nr:MAG: Ferri-bacillibactin esterase BesA [Paracidovorax wautersii]
MTPDMSRYDLARPLDATVADHGSPHYRFSDVRCASADGQRRYVVRMAVPERAAPAAGHALVCLLDGNAAFAALTLEQLAALDATGTPPVIAAIGYDTALGFDVQARSFDYTPPLDAPGVTLAERARGRIGGGAELFLDLLQTQLLPGIARHAPIDPQRRALWGHSFGGLLALHTLFTRPALFSRYAVADPSMWWHDGYLLHHALRATPPALARPVRLLVMAGSSAAEVAAAGPRPLRPGIDPEVAARARAERRCVPPDAARQMALRLQDWPGLAVDYQGFPGISHGPLLATSLGPALVFCSEN